MNKKKLILIISIILTIIISIILVTYVLIRLSYKNNIPAVIYDADNISIKKLDKELYWLKEQNYKTFSMDDFYNWKKGKEIDGKKVLITFKNITDDNYKNILKELKKYHTKAIMFIDNNLSEDTLNNIIKSEYISLASANLESTNYSYILNTNNISNETLKENKYLLSFNENNAWISKDTNDYSLSVIPITNKTTNLKYKMYILFEH